MKINSRLFLLYPVIIILLYVGLDSVFKHPVVKQYTQSDGTYLYFDYKPELLDELEAVHRDIEQGQGISVYPDNPESPEIENVERKILLVLGSSRLMYFNFQEFSRHFPDWEMFNFSAPVTAPAYYAYIMERILERGIEPDYIILETDPFQFNDSSDAFSRSNVSYSFDLRYMLSNFHLFERSEFSHFLAGRLFSGYRYPPDPENIVARLKDPEHQFLLAIREQDRFQRENRGAAMSVIPRDDWYQRDFANLYQTSQFTLNWLYGNYRLSDRQFTFLDQMLADIRARNIPVIFVRPQVSPALQRMIDENETLGPAQAEWRERINRRIGNSPYLDLTDSEDFFCNTFVDGSHMSLDCYHPMLSLLIDHYEEAREVVDEQ